MSIILRALKKLQEEKAREADAPPADGAEKEDSTSTGEAVPSSLAVGDDESSPDAAQDYMEDIAVRPRPESPKREAARQRFGVGPKALLIVVLMLGIFTTGWFASRIYLNMKLATSSGESGPQTNKPAAVVSKAALSEPRQEHAIEPAAVAPADSKQESSPSATASALPPIADAIAVEPAPEPPKRVDEKPRLEERKPKREGRPELKINAIAWRSKEPKAIVNMQRVFEGDVIEGATVLAIQRKAILFEYDGESFEVRF